MNKNNYDNLLWKGTVPKEIFACIHKDLFMFVLASDKVGNYFIYIFCEDDEMWHEQICISVYWLNDLDSCFKEFNKFISTDKKCKIAMKGYECKQ